MDAAIIVALVSLFGVIVGPVIGGLIQDRHARRKERHDYLESNIQTLINIRTELHYLQQIMTVKEATAQKVTTSEGAYEVSPLMGLKIQVDGPAAILNTHKELSVLIGRAFAIMVSIDDKAIRHKARTPLASDDPYGAAEVVDFALMRLGDLYSET